ncbi:transposase InsO family protein [Agrobacterium tumefaciens]|nr:transposase InsO family protein [Agrobacterium tumefaciens]MBP2574099.1 transposase InsO family protein [Agrobacterium tumefaciens]
MLKVDRSLYVYKSRRGEQAELKLKIKDICQTRVRYGYRRVHILIKREGWPVNPKRIYRLYKEMDLQLRNKVPKRRVKAKLRADRTEPTHSNHVWAMDFVHDQLATGRKIRVLTVVDTYSRFSPAVDARVSYKGEDVVQTLERVCRQVGYPTTIRVDNVLYSECIAVLAAGRYRIGLPIRLDYDVGPADRQRTVSPITNTEYA